MSKNTLKILIPIQPVTKKNHGRIVTLKDGRRIMLPSEPYVKYEKACKQFIPQLKKPIDFPIEMKCTYYMGHRRKSDITNLLQATCDILVKYGVLSDDNYLIIQSFDGTRVYYDKENPRCEIEIKKIDE